MANMTPGQIGLVVRLAFPAGTIQRVEVLEYGDNPEIEPGQVAIRIFRQVPPEHDGESSHETLRRFVEANRQVVRKLGQDLPSIGWLEFRLGGEQPTGGHGPSIRTAPGGSQQRTRTAGLAPAR